MWSRYIDFMVESPRQNGRGDVGVILVESNGDLDELAPSLY